MVSSTPASAGEKIGHYRVLHVIDGDTFDATDRHIKFRVRIAGMDAPESRQAFGQWATAEMKKAIEGKDVAIHPVGKGLDQYNRILGQVFVGGKDLSVLMIERGFAFYYRPRCRDFPEDNKLYQYDPRPYVQAEAAARAAHLVVWSQGAAKLPCSFRKENPRVASRNGLEFFIEAVTRQDVAQIFLVDISLFQEQADFHFVFFPGGLDE